MAPNIATIKNEMDILKREEEYYINMKLKQIKVLKTNYQANSQK